MDVVLRVNTGILLFVCTCIRYVKLCFTFCRRSKRVAAPEDPLLTVPAVLLAEKIRNREVSCRKVISTYIKRINDVNAAINAVAEDRFEAALEEAQKVDDFLQNNDSSVIEQLKSTKPLFGVPVTIKENLQVRGLSATMCCILYKDQKAPIDGAAVQKLKEAGAIVLLVSTTPEFCLTIDTYSLLYGVTRNPYNNRRSVGGSSGGEGALLGAGASLIGLGSDLAGSIRYPSAFNGVFGHKPTHGMISTEGHMPPLDDDLFRKYTVVGPMSRYAVDLPLLMKVLSDNNRVLNLDDKVDLSKLKIFYMEEFPHSFGLMKVSSDIKRAIRDCAELLSDQCKSHVQETKFDNLGYSMEICVAVSTEIQFSSPLETKERTYGVLSQMFASLFGLSKFSNYILLHQVISDSSKATTSKAKVEKYKKMLDELRKEMNDALSDCGVLLIPAYPSTAPRHRETTMGYAAMFYSFIVNMLGFPSTTVPVGFDRNNLPIGIQVVANVNQDRICFAVAEELESLLGGWKL